MVKSKGRKPTPKEMEIWNTVAQTAVPRQPLAATPADPDLAVFEKSLPQPNQPKAISPPSYSVPKFQIGETAQPKQPAAKTPVAPFDPQLYKKIGRGKKKPEGKLDLHGMTVDEAQHEVSHFIMRSVMKQRRLVLIVTGKGQRYSRDTFSFEPVGILKRMLPIWLSKPPLSSEVLDFTEAHQHQGGSGAYYVHLRRKG